MTGQYFESLLPGQKVDKVDKGGGKGGLSTFSTLYPPNGLLKTDSQDWTQRRLYTMVWQSLRRIDQVGTPWTGWIASLSKDRRARLVEIEQGIDQAYLAEDMIALAEWLKEYEDFCLLPFRTRRLH